MGSLDAALAAHLLRLREAHAEDTALFIVSDHGIHYGTYYDGGEAGKQEHSLPLFYALLPRSLLAHQPQLEATLCANTQRLISPFDLHATLLHFLSHPKPPRVPDWGFAPFRVRPRSLFTPIPHSRTCEDAGIPQAICPCTSG